MAKEKRAERRDAGLQGRAALLFPPLFSAPPMLFSPDEDESKRNTPAMPTLKWVGTGKHARVDAHPRAPRCGRMFGKGGRRG